MQAENCKSTMSPVPWNYYDTASNNMVQYSKKIWTRLSLSSTMKKRIYQSWYGKNDLNAAWLSWNVEHDVKHRCLKLVLIVSWNTFQRRVLRYETIASFVRDIYGSENSLSQVEAFFAKWTLIMI